MVSFLPESAKIVLDVGCSSGGFAKSLREARPELEIWGIEPFADAASIAQNDIDRVIVGDFPSVLPQLSDTRFDAVFFNDVLEHMAEPEDALTAAHQVISPGGTVVASIPNVRHFSVVWPLLRRGQWTYQDAGILDRTHLRFFTRSSVLRLFRGTGWEVSAIMGINRCVDPATGTASLACEVISRASLRRLDPFIVSQYAVSASSRRR